MILYLVAAVLLLVWPYPQRLRAIGGVFFVVLALCFGFSGGYLIEHFGADGLLLGSGFVGLAIGFAVRAYRSRPVVA